MSTGTETAAAPARGGGFALSDIEGGGRVRTPDGYTVAASTARKAMAATPGNTDRGRESRMAGYVRWCQVYGRLHTDPGTLADYAGWLSDQLHPAETITTYTTTIAERLAAGGYVLLDSERTLIRGVIAERAQSAARDPDGQGDALQATECTREDLAAMLAVLDRATVEGIRNALILCLDWYLAGRASEPAGLNLRDTVETSVELVHQETGELVDLAALVVTIRLSKTNPYGRTTDVVRILAQDDETCPVTAWRAWCEVLTRHGVTSGPLLRRVKRGQLTTAGRPPADPTRAGGIGDRTIRNLIHDCARAAGLIRELTMEERELLSTRGDAAALTAAADDVERDAIRADLRVRRRALRRRLPRYSGHSMRRGYVRHMQREGEPRHVIERQARYRPGSAALNRYLDDLVAWSENPTIPRRLRHRTGPRIIVKKRS
ncbi:hypothetical protein ACIOEX_02410 [Streptomyces sp. NPDC087850]|uniref:hypothetical protein n=1 Tax=Streptomyces sp. NPDC087850 TaxID=3365809 RepID=UPI003830B3D3